MPCTGGCDWLTSRGTQPHRALSTGADLAELFFGDFLLQARTQRSVGVDPACAEARKGLPPRSLDSGDVIGGGCRRPCCRWWCVGRGRGMILFALREVGLCGVGSSAWRLNFSTMVVACRAGAWWEACENIERAGTRVFRGRVRLRTVYVGNEPGGRSSLNLAMRSQLQLVRKVTFLHRFLQVHYTDPSNACL